MSFFFNKNKMDKRINKPKGAAYKQIHEKKQNMLMKS